jgi:transposase-like protein
MSEFAQVGDFCPKPGCSDYGELQKGNIIKFGKTKACRQRYRCHSCDGTFTETKGTIFFRKRTPEREIMEVLALIAEGSRVSSVARVKGHKEDTIVEWLRDAAQHAQAIEAELLKNFQIERGQLDAMWSYVGNKGEKRAIPRQQKAVSSGVRR